MMSVTRTLRQKLPSVKAVPKFSQTAVKTSAANIHTVKLVQLHNTLHLNKEPELQFCGLQVPRFPLRPASSPAPVALLNQGQSMAVTPFMFHNMAPPMRASIAGAAKQTISAMISASAQTQINRIRESHGRFQDKYLYGSPKPSPKPATSQEKPITDESRATPTSAAVSEIKKDVAASVFGNKVKKAQRTLSNEDLANAFDL